MKKEPLLFLVVIAITGVNARVYYLQNLDEDRNDAVYSVPNEQSSRDLDLSFSAGDWENENEMRPYRKVYHLVSSDESPIEVKYPVRPSRYRLSEEHLKRDDDVVLVSGKPPKLSRINDNNRGEVILELRVIANHNSA